MKCENCGTEFIPRSEGQLPVCSRCLVQGAMSPEFEHDETIPSEKPPRGKGAEAAYADRDELQGLFPDFEMLDRLGAGGMGAVFKARQKSLDRMVAIKILNPKLAGDPEFQERFEREGKAMAMLSHPNIVGIHDFGVREGFHFLVMEYVDGCDLQRLIRSEEVDEAIAFSVITQVCDALHFAHEQGVVHRDVKPGNIFVDKSGAVKIGDFGLARIAKQDTNVSLTMTGAGMGTPSYMAPEQLEDAKAIDARADIYALGVVIYEMLTGKVPAGNFPPPTSKLPRRNKRLDRAVLRAMEPNPKNRFSDVREISRAMGRKGKFESGAPVKGKLNRTVSIVATVAGVLVVGLLATHFKREYDRKDELTENSFLIDETTKQALEDPFENSLGMKFLPVPITGGPSDGKRVLFSIWETRIEDYAAFVESDPDREWPEVEFPQGENHPALNVSWTDATAFCEWLTAVEREKGVLDDDKHYRLPSDHEWSCAVGIGLEEDAALLPIVKDGVVTKIFPWGTGFPPPKGAGSYFGGDATRSPLRVRRQIGSYKDGFDRTAPVGSFRANQYGLYDMGGNAWEWCQDWQSLYQNRRVMRGSSWFGSISGSLLSSRRGSQPPNARDSISGFRVVIGEGELSGDAVEVDLDRLLPHVGPGISAEYDAVRRRGGVLRLWEENDGGIDISKAEGLNDILSVDRPMWAGGNWSATRIGGEMVSTIPSLDQRFDLRLVRSSFSIEWPDKLVPMDPRHHDHLPLMSPVERAVDVWIRGNVAFIVTSDGRLALAAEDDWIKENQYVVNRVKTLKDVVSVVGYGRMVAMLTSDGKAICWHSDFGFFDPPDDPRKLVQLATGMRHVTGLYEDGRVATWWHSKDILNPRIGDAQIPPKEMGPVIRVESADFFSAAQHPDGSWTAWGDDNGAGLVDQINSIGVALDMGLYILVGEVGAKLLWIEPAPESDEPIASEAELDSVGKPANKSEISQEVP